jgi:ABC-type transport system involved in multi-copper enzyme maturation permease subunit
MTALTVPASPAQDDASLRPLPWRRMAWVTWRQHRMALAGVTVFVGVLAVWVWRAGLGLHHAYAAAAACRPAGSFACGDLTQTFDAMDSFLAPGWVLQVVPALIGTFVGAPVLARELETGTFRYAWTQGFGRWRWALAKLALLAVVLAAAAGAFSVLLSWYYQPYFGTGNQNLSLSEASPLAGGLFDLHGPAFAAWTLAAFAIGALAGMIIRRVVPAIAASLAIYAGLAVAAVTYLRLHYLTPLVIRNNFPAGSALMLSRWWIRGGTPVSQSVASQVLQGAPAQAAGKGGVPQSLGAVQYLNQHGFTQWISYQPASRFWPFQWIEGGWLLALSVLLIAVTVWLVRRRAT